MKQSNDIPMAAVIMSIHKAHCKLERLITAPAAAGAAKLAIDCKVELMPLALISFSGETIRGIAEFTEGVWIPAAAERRAAITSRAILKEEPLGKRGIIRTRARVKIAIAASAPIISDFLGKRSASAPPRKEQRNCGTKEQTVSKATHKPELVSMVIYQIMANATICEPKSVIAWLMKNVIAFFILCNV